VHEVILAQKQVRHWPSSQPDGTKAYFHESGLTSLAHPLGRSIHTIDTPCCEWRRVASRHNMSQHLSAQILRSEEIWVSVCRIVQAAGTTNRVKPRSHNWYSWHASIVDACYIVETVHLYKYWTLASFPFVGECGTSVKNDHGSDVLLRYLNIIWGRLSLPFG
jgi:hypothetical protein